MIAEQREAVARAESEYSTLAARLDLDGQDFKRKAWPHLRANLVEQARSFWKLSG